MQKRWFLTPNRSVLSLFRLFLPFHRVKKSLCHIIKKREDIILLLHLYIQEKNRTKDAKLREKENSVFVYCRMLLSAGTKHKPSPDNGKFRETSTWKQNHRVINASIKLGPQKCRQILPAEAKGDVSSRPRVRTSVYRKHQKVLKGRAGP